MAHHNKSISKRTPWRPMIALGFLAITGLLALTHHLWPAVPGIYLIASLVSFVVYAIDKSKAKQNKWRTPEATLLTIDLLGGWPGGLLAQNFLRHKNQKTSYQIKFILVTFINILVLCLLHWYGLWQSLSS